MLFDITTGNRSEENGEDGKGRGRNGRKREGMKFALPLTKSRKLH